MAKIVGIHGIAQTYTGAATLAQTWYNALLDGFHVSNYPPVSSDNFEMVFYGDIFRRTGYRGNTEISIVPDEAWETAMLEMWWREAWRLSRLSNGGDGNESPLIQAPDGDTRARAPRLLQRGLIQLSKTKYFSALSSKDLLRKIHEVWAFLHDTDIKSAVLERVFKTIAPDTRIVIGHSMGSIVAYEAACRLNHELDVLVTIGSPLGVRNLVFDKLTPRPEAGRGQWPSGVKHWINIADEGDIVALEKKLAPFFGAVSDKMVYNGWKSHDISRYLSSPVLGEALLEIRGN
nr:alpha/beta hydrolase [uncultured Chitinophaga sp.]